MNIYTITITYGDYDNIPRIVRFFVPRGITYEKVRRVFKHELLCAGLGYYRHKVEVVDDALSRTARECYGRYEMITPDDQFDMCGLVVR